MHYMGAPPGRLQGGTSAMPSQHGASKQGAKLKNDPTSLDEEGRTPLRSSARRATYCVHPEGLLKYVWGETVASISSLRSFFGGRVDCTGFFGGSASDQNGADRLKRHDRLLVAPHAPASGCPAGIVRHTGDKCRPPATALAGSYSKIP